MDDEDEEQLPFTLLPSQETLVRQLALKHRLYESEKQALAELRDAEAAWLGDTCSPTEEQEEKSREDVVSSREKTKSRGGHRFKRFTHEQIRQRIAERSGGGYGFLLMEAAVRSDLLGCTFDTGHESWKCLLGHVRVVGHPLGVSEGNRLEKWALVLFGEMGVDGWEVYLQGKGWEEIVGKLDELEVELDLYNQRVIRMDCLRTRQDQQLFRSSDTRLRMEQILTAYCKAVGVNYKQGMNYLLAPFVAQITRPSKCLAFFAAFLARFLPSTFADDGFGVLQCLFRVFDMLLGFHDPRLHRHLTLAMMSPELYAASWFITLFSNRLHPHVLLHLWDRLLLLEQSPETQHHVFHYFVWLALVIWHRKSLLASTDLLPELLNKIILDSSDQVDCVFKLAQHLLEDTPQSILTLLSTISASESIPVDSPLFLELMESSCITVSAAQVVNDWANGFVVLDCRGFVQGEGRLDEEMSVVVECERVGEEGYVDGLVDRVRSAFISGRICIMDESGDRHAVKELVQALQERMLRFICFCEGGFRDVHQILASQGLLDTHLSDHFVQLCRFCQPNFTSAHPNFIDFSTSNEVKVFGAQMCKGAWITRDPSLSLKFRQRLLVKVFSHYLDAIDLNESQRIVIVYQDDALKTLLDPCIEIFKPVLDIQWEKIAFHTDLKEYNDESGKVSFICEKTSNLRLNSGHSTIGKTNVVLLYEEIHWKNVSNVASVLYQLSRACESENVSIDLLGILSLLCGRRCGERLADLYQHMSERILVITAISQHSSFKTLVPGLE